MNPKEGRGKKEEGRRKKEEERGKLIGDRSMLIIAVRCAMRTLQIESMRKS
ncbi:MAG: hypothetical protein HC942_26410 [Microcoleus sp. SU_5_6]|nr:hypothetical protein [Microcoleus sp. SU_5_6]NJL68833.1 hypothetical protein [Microcoleus sp. SM1_3_4]